MTASRFVLPLALAAAAFSLPATMELSPGAARAASFDCGQARTATEKAICANPALSALDGELAAAYTQRLARDPSVRQIQRAWLAARSAGCGRRVGCLTTFTNAQLAWLRGATPMAAALPKTPGRCALTLVKEVTTRLEEADDKPVPGSGSTIIMANGVVGVSYEQLPEVDSARRGDAMVVCLVSLPRDCPPGDDRG